MTRYWQKEDESDSAFTEDGYFKTGDIAVLHKDGFISIADRAKDIIIVSGFNVYPNEVEEIASQHPDIIECAAIGIPDEVTGESVKLFVVTTNNELTLEDIRSYCRGKLTGYKIPKSMQIAEELPKLTLARSCAAHLEMTLVVVKGRTSCLYQKHKDANKSTPGQSTQAPFYAMTASGILKPA